MNSKHCGHKKIKRFFASVFILLITVRLAVCLHLFSSLNQPWKIRFNIPNFKLTIFTIFLDGRTFFQMCLNAYQFFCFAGSGKSKKHSDQCTKCTIVPSMYQACCLIPNLKYVKNSNDNFQKLAKLPF